MKMAELGVHQSALLTDLALCVNRYRLFSPGWYVCVLAKVQLSSEEWEVPGLVAMVNYGSKKQCEVRNEVFQGAPNFVLDVFDSKDDKDFLRRHDRFCRYGVHEYVVVLNSEPLRLLWHRLDAVGYRLVEPDDDGIIRSSTLPNLWLPAKSVQDPFGVALSGACRAAPISADAFLRRWLLERTATEQGAASDRDLRLVSRGG
jgi:putative restriction endonuclease